MRHMGKLDEVKDGVECATDKRHLGFVKLFTVSCYQTM